MPDAAAALHAVLIDFGALAVAVLGDGQDACRRAAAPPSPTTSSSSRSVMPTDAVGRAAHGPDVGLREADRHAVRRPDEDLALPVGELHARSRASPSSMPMAMMPPARGLLKAASSVFLTVPLRVHITMKPVRRVELAHGQQRRDLLVGLHRHEVGDGLALAGGHDVRDLVDLQPVARGPCPRRSGCSCASTPRRGG